MSISTKLNQYSAMPSCRVNAPMRGVLVTLFVIGSAFPLQSQIVPTTGPQRASRGDLVALAARLDKPAATAKETNADRAKTSAALTGVRLRLEQGDFQVGDRFIVTIRQDTIKSDTVQVRDGLMVTVGNLPDVSLKGVLRAELDERVNRHVALYLREASVRTTVLTRIAILGAVRTPGFYYAAPDRSITDLVMLAGGPAPDANLNELGVSRSQVKFLKEKDSRRAIKDGRTLEQLDIQSGDEVVIPMKKKVNWGLIIQSVLLVTTLMFSAFQFLQWYYSRKNE